MTYRTGHVGGLVRPETAAASPEGSPYRTRAGCGRSASTQFNCRFFRMRRITFANMAFG